MTEAEFERSQSQAVLPAVCCQAGMEELSFKLFNVLFGQPIAIQTEL